MVQIAPPNIQVYRVGWGNMGLFQSLFNFNQSSLPIFYISIKTLCVILAIDLLVIKKSQKFKIEFYPSDWDECFPRPIIRPTLPSQVGRRGSIYCKTLIRTKTQSINIVVKQHKYCTYLLNSCKNSEKNNQPILRKVCHCQTNGISNRITYN